MTCPESVKWHAIFVEDGRVQDYEIAAMSFYEAEQVLMREHPRMTYWEIGAPLETFMGSIKVIHG